MVFHSIPDHVFALPNILSLIFIQIRWYVWQMWKFAGTGKPNEGILQNKMKHVSTGQIKIKVF